MLARNMDMPRRRRRRAAPIFSTSVRLSPEIVERIDYVLQRKPVIASRSEAIQLALEWWLDKAEKQLEAEDAMAKVAKRAPG